MTRNPTAARTSGAPGAPGAHGQPAHIDLVETYFDDNAGDWSDLYRQAQRVNDIVLADRKNTALDHLVRNVPAGGRILDAGCGAGLLSADLLERGFTVHGVDVSQKMLDHAARTFAERGFPSERYELSCTDLLEARLPEASFDGIAALGFLQYQVDEPTALRELKRLLKPGGVLVVTGPNSMRAKLTSFFGFAKTYYAMRRRLAHPLRKAAPVALHPSIQLLHKISTHYYSPGRFRSLLRDAGFRVVACKGHGFSNWAIVGQKLGFRGELALHRFCTRAARVLPIGRWANDIIAVGRTEP